MIPSGAAGEDWLATTRGGGRAPQSPSSGTLPRLVPSLTILIPLSAHPFHAYIYSTVACLLLLILSRYRTACAPTVADARSFFSSATPLTPCSRCSCSFLRLRERFYEAFGADCRSARRFFYDSCKNIVVGIGVCTFEGAQRKKCTPEGTIESPALFFVPFSQVAVLRSSSTRTSPPPYPASLRFTFPPFERRS